MLEWANAVAGSKLIPVPRSLNGRLAEWLYLSGAARTRPSAQVHHCFVAAMRLGKSGRKVQAGTAANAPGNCADSHRFDNRRSADIDFVTDGKTIGPANSNTCRACIGRANKICTRGLRADLRDSYGLNAMADARDIEPDLVADRDVGDRRNFDVGRAGCRVRAKIGLRARLADCGNGRYFVLLNGARNGGIGCAISERNLFADLETVRRW